jgi:hypothetical protein
MPVIRQKQSVLNSPVGVARIDTGASQLWQQVAQTADTIRGIAVEDAARKAKAKGIDTAKAVETARLTTINPESGEPEALTIPDGFGTIATDAYRSVVNRRFEDSMDNELRLKAKELAIKHSLNPEAYGQAMSQYIESMSVNAVGQYKQFVVENGTNYLASTKTNLQKQAMVRARAASANAIASALDQGVGSAYSTALTGNFEDAAALGERQIVNVTNGTRAGLLKSNASGKAAEQFDEAIAKGGVEYILSKTQTSADRNAVDLAIRTRGNNIAGVPKELRDDVKAVINHISPKNIEGVLRHSSVVGSDYNAVERDMIAASQAEAKMKARRNEVQYGDSVTDAGLYSSSVATEAFGSDNVYDVGSGVGIATQKFGRITNNVNSRFLNDSSYTETQRDADLKEARQSILRPFLIEAAAEGNPSELAVAIQTRHPKDMENLTPKQKAFVSSLGDTAILNPLEDMGFVRSELSASTNSIRDAREKERAKFKMTQAVTALGETAEFGGITEDAYTAMEKRITDAVGVSMTSVQANSELARLNRQRAFGELNLFSAGANSSDLNNLATYIDSQGQRSAGMSASVIDAGNKILSMTDADDIDALTGKIGGLRVTIANQEAADQKVIEQQQDVTRILGGGGRANSTKDQNMVQEMLDDVGVDLTQFDLLPDDRKSQVYSLIKTVPPTKLLNALNDISSGIEVPSSEAWLNMFARMESDITPTGGTINRFGDSLGVGTVEFLRDVNQIRMTVGGNAGEIAQKLRDMRSDPKSKINLDVQLEEMTPTQYVMDYASSDPIVASELAPAVEYLARTGKSQSQINNRLDTLIDQKYPKSEFIADPRFPVGSIKRSRYSLAAVFPDEGEQTAFTQAIESQLPAGYSLYGDKLNAKTLLDMVKGVTYLAKNQEEVDALTSAPTDTKQVYLVPDESTAGVTYFAYFVDENAELKPLIYEKDGVRTFPAFDKSETEEYRTKAAADRAAALEESMNASEQMIDALRGRPGFRSFQDAKNQLIGN